MRIIAGKLGGRQFRSPNGHRTHPMSDKMRGGLFNSLGDIAGLSVLDAFAGSGALSFEAVSRDAALAVALDVDANAQRVIQENIKALSLGGRVKLIRASAAAWLRTADQSFDIVIVDPPYDKPQLDLLIELAGRAKPGGLVILSLPPTERVELDDSYKLLSTKNYGDGQLSFYRVSA
jgi:16S rRNA (guanine966-N2)-methyltransferase